MAPVHMYFHPREMKKNDENEPHFKAQFRGRSLIAPSVQPVQGLVLGTANDNKMISFDGIQEWHHEETLLGTTSRVDNALEWMRVSNALHNEIDLPAPEDNC
eukprot:CAMPEP_0178895518 /NCGR_PEP_ID=MMETSP0786-20121207/637_1 /TAXON_ID=186022 /ORGANISM="Thalassionema frauenfeldii, Strain CCMP 1798" /LENGTH=101 /DNA_ID=CAMNT_0020565769 /DNA_START=42 /DNA_END=347 /DNA_ORIENTATION=+